MRKVKIFLESCACPIVAFYLSLGHRVVTQDPAVQKTGCLRTYGTFTCHILALSPDKLGSEAESLSRR